MKWQKIDKNVFYNLILDFFPEIQISLKYIKVPKSLDPTLCQKSVNVAGTVAVPNIFCRQSHFLIYSVLLPNTGHQRIFGPPVYYSTVQEGHQKM
jgi:hypothetical protein